MFGCVIEPYAAETYPFFPFFPFLPFFGILVHLFMFLWGVYIHNRIMRSAILLEFHSNNKLSSWRDYLFFILIWLFLQ